MKKFGKDQRKPEIKIRNYLKKRSLTKGENQLHHDEQVFLIYAKQISIDDKEYKVRFHCNYTRKYRGALHKMCNLR